MYVSSLGDCVRIRLTIRAMQAYYRKKGKLQVDTCQVSSIGKTGTQKRDPAVPLGEVWWDSVSLDHFSRTGPLNVSMRRTGTGL